MLISESKNTETIQLVGETLENINLQQEIHELELLTSIEENGYADDGDFLRKQIEEEEREEERLAKKSGKKLTKSSSLKEFFKVKPLNKWIKGSVSYSTTPYNLTNGKQGRETLNFPITFSPVKYFFLSANFKYDVNSYNNIYYQPDFSYSFGYSDWHTDTWAVVYSNYANNKLNPKEGEERFNFDAGRWDLTYKTKVDGVKLKGSFQYKESSGSQTLKLTASKTFFDKVSTSAMWKHFFHYKQERLTLSAKSFIYKKFMVSGSAFIYSNYNLQKTGEYDYAYSFGWYDTRPYYPTITYSTYYMPTRWPARSQDDVPFGSGIVSVKMKF